MQLLRRLKVLINWPFSAKEKSAHDQTVESYLEAQMAWMEYRARTGDNRDGWLCGDQGIVELWRDCDRQFRAFEETRPSLPGYEWGISPAPFRLVPYKISHA